MKFGVSVALALANLLFLQVQGAFLPFYAQDSSKLVFCSHSATKKEDMLSL